MHFSIFGLFNVLLKAFILNVYYFNNNNNNDNNSILTLSIAIIKMTLFLLFFSMVNREGSKTL